MRFSKAAILILLCLWAGAAIMFAAIAAPAIFNPNVLDNRELSGAIAGAILRRLFQASYFVFGICLLLSLLGWLANRKPGNPMKLLFFLCLFLFCVNLAQDRLIRAEMVRIKLELKNTGDSRQTAELKNRFSRLHGLSTLLYGTSTLAALAGVAYVEIHRVRGSRKK